ncbi:MAG: hypothetical protein AAGH64_02910 [Planctomycetota bacterium]
MRDDRGNKIRRDCNNATLDGLRPSIRHHAPARLRYTFYAWTFLAIIAVLWIGFAPSAISSSIPVTIRYVALFATPIALACAFITFPSEKWAGLHTLIRSKHLCVACLFELEDFPPEPDGCTVCPECSAAWRLTAPQDA